MRYRIRVRGHLDAAWAVWFDGLAIIHEADGDTTLAGPLGDQAALYGVLNRARDLGLTLVAVSGADDGVGDDAERGGEER
jgi:hypothetical protein